MIYTPPENYVVFNGKSLVDFDVYVSGEGTFLSPEREYTSVTIPGKNGDLLFDGGRYKNVEITYPAFILQDLKTNLFGLRGWLLSATGYCRLEDTYHPEEYRLAAYHGPLTPQDVLWLDGGRFDLTFDCKPQRFLKIGDEPVTISSQDNLNNTTNFASKPLIRVYGSGTLHIGTDTVTVLSHPTDYIDIDCEIQDCFCGTTNCNNYIRFQTGEFPTLPPGATEIRIEDSIDHVDIYPRWWML